MVDRYKYSSTFHGSSMEKRPDGDWVRAEDYDALVKAIENDLADAKAVCGGDGEGCETYRGYYDSAERRHRKCGQCPMDAIFHARRALASLDVAVLKGDRFTGTDCDFYEPGNGDACMNCGTTHESPAVERPAP